MRPPDWNGTPRPRPPQDDPSQMTHAELVREIRRLRVLVAAMHERLAGDDQ